jgi:threonine/homoserine/homoserine lactone efflux protein
MNLPTTSILGVFVFSFIMGMSGVMSPGPVSTAIVSQAPRRGWLVGPLLATGHAVLELALVILIALGLGAGLARPGIRLIIAILGGLLLIGMGASMLWDNWRGKLHMPSQDEKLSLMSYRQIIGLGMLATLTNPFWYAWWVTVAAGYLAWVQALGIAAVAAFYLGHVTADYAWDTVLSTIMGGGRRWMNDAIYMGMLVVCGGFFMYLGILFLNQGLRGL